MIDIFGLILNFIQSIVNSMTAAEIAMGMYNIDVLGLTVEHPFVFIFILPAFLIALYIGTNHPKLGGMISSFALAVAFLCAIIVVAVGLSTIALVELSFFISMIPLIFIIGIVVGWMINFSLNRTCRNREGGILCKIVE